MNRDKNIHDELKDVTPPRFANPAHRERLERELRRAWTAPGETEASFRSPRRVRVRFAYALAGAAFVLLAIGVTTATVTHMIAAKSRTASTIAQLNRSSGASDSEFTDYSRPGAPQNANGPAPKTSELSGAEVGVTDRPALSEEESAREIAQAGASRQVDLSFANVLNKDERGRASSSSAYGYGPGYGTVRPPQPASAPAATPAILSQFDSELGKASDAAIANGPADAEHGASAHVDGLFAGLEVDGSSGRLIAQADATPQPLAVDQNFFRYDNAFNILDYVTDDTTSLLKFSFTEGESRENVSNNGDHDLDSLGRTAGANESVEIAGAAGNWFSFRDSMSADQQTFGTEWDFSELAPGATDLLSVQDPAAIQEQQTAESNTETYKRIYENSFLAVAQNPLSTFSIDVDTASYSNVRRFLTSGQLPPPDAVRIEELINYFSYDYPLPENGIPFSVTTDLVDCPWNDAHQLLRVGLKGYELSAAQRPPANLVFLLDVSGSMNQPNKLPLVQESMRMLTEQLAPTDTVSIVVYAGAAGLVLPPTSGGDKPAILDAIDRLKAGGSTHGAEGILLAYLTAMENFKEEGINRVILATDGDFNVGASSEGELTRIIEEHAKGSGVFLTCLGFGMGNYKDTTLETLADKGNGNYAYIDTANEARKALVEEINSTLVTIAKDVKIQIEFNPLKIDSYRLIGYENRMLAAEDFNDDTKDAGEIGAGHTVTALYELVPAGASSPAAGGEGRAVDPLRYQQTSPTGQASLTDEALVVKLRYKQPESDTSDYIDFPVSAKAQGYYAAPLDMKWAAAVAAFGLVLRDSEYKGAATLDFVERQALENIGADPYGYRAEFVELVKKARELMGAEQARLD